MKFKFSVLLLDMEMISPPIPDKFRIELEHVNGYWSKLKTLILLEQAMLAIVEHIREEY
jgi:hypothetical protein